MQDAKILAQLGLPKLNAYFFRRKNVIVNFPIQLPAFLPGFGFFRSRTLLESPAHERYGEDAREKTLGKAALLLAEAKEKGNYAQLMQLDPVDPRHPYYFEHPWQSALKTDSYTLSPYQQYLRWHCITWRALHDWDMMGMQHDDILTPRAMETDPFLEEAIKRLPYVVRLERERRLARAYDMCIRREYLPDEADFTHPEDDVAYLIPYYHMVVDEHREAHDNPVDFYSR
mmetsp:Transcript_42525/g.76323  ORF Transcript_42525/g.76323 Transcript_42525/m.76323 type:complete len:229 (-) Transcript_42525:227-913(-)